MVSSSYDQNNIKPGGLLEVDFKQNVDSLTINTVIGRQLCKTGLMLDNTMVSSSLNIKVALQIQQDDADLFSHHNKVQFFLS